MMAGKPGVPTHWLAYTSVENVDGAVEKAQSLGAEVLVPPMDIPNVGRMAILRDPQGAAFAPFKSTTPPSPEEKPMPGFFCWEELQANDPEAAAKFYAEVYGWKVRPPESMSDPHGYWHVMRGDGKDVGGMMKAHGGTPPSWLSYVAVANVDTVTAKAQGLGAKVLVEPRDVKGAGRFSVLMDPQNGVFALYKG
jgi:predicted enzyme related to lactoylglutathione lyase